MISRDANHYEIANALRTAGVRVVDLSAAGGGCADLFCARWQVWCFVEVKTDEGRLGDSQIEFARLWADRYHVVRTKEEALALFGIGDGVPLALPKPVAPQKKPRTIAAKRAERIADGDLTPVQWAAILKAYEDRCAYCGRRMDGGFGPTRDHVRPLAKGGKDTASNVVPACWNCNTKKGRSLRVPSTPPGGHPFREEPWEVGKW